MTQPNLVLIGFMACGKSTIGRACASALGFGFRDSDALVARRAGRSIPSIFAELGEQAFRDMEARAIRDLAATRQAVIATGGGAVLSTGNVFHLRRTGVVVLLLADPATIIQRVGDCSSRPLLACARDPQERVEELLREREPYYRSAAHATVDTTGLARDDAVERVLAAYHGLAPARQRPGPAVSHRAQDSAR